MKILLGITGGIAAYKTPELVRCLTARHADVQCVMTDSAKAFTTPLTLQALSGRPVRDTLFDTDAEAAMSHIELARWADHILIAPASANCIAKLAHGLADDLLSTLCLATTAPISIAPAMNQQMWHNPITQSNVQTLVNVGVDIIGPASGEQACGEVGLGRMCEPVELADAILTPAEPGALTGQTVLITAGPTREPIDPVRFISNRSSGKMGYALAEAAQQAGAQVVLITGPTALTPPGGVRCVAVMTTAQMHEAVMQEVVNAEVFISAAAVADYRASLYADQKIKKSADVMTLELEKNADIVSGVTRLPNAPFSVAFAAETHNVLDHAREKLLQKKVDMIIANRVGDQVGFDVDKNSAVILMRGSEEFIELPLMSKREMAVRIIERVAERLVVSV